jgi:D-xylose transport system ATP-binding protein
LRLRGVQKRYGSVTALRGVDLDVAVGEVVALVGDNGAGKSTLIKTISGAAPADEGEFFVNGRAAKLSSPHAATELGIATVYQDLALCENLDVVANLFLGSELARTPFVGVLRRLSEPQMNREARRILSSLAVTLPGLDQPVAGLSGGQRQAVAVARALLFGARLVILDEPTAALGVQQTQQVLGLVRRLADQGQAVLLISHSLPDVFTVADRIVVLRLGANAGSFVRRETAVDEVVSAMTGGLTLRDA